MNHQYYSSSQTYEEVNGVPQKDIRRVNHNGHIQIQGTIQGMPFSYNNLNPLSYKRDKKKNKIHPFSQYSRFPPLPKNKIKFRQPTPYPRKSNKNQKKPEKKTEKKTEKKKKTAGGKKSNTRKRQTKRKKN